LPAFLAVAGKVDGRGHRVAEAQSPSNGGTEIEIRQVFEADDFGAELTSRTQRAGSAPAQAIRRKKNDGCPTPSFRFFGTTGWGRCKHHGNLSSAHHEAGPFTREEPWVSPYLFEPQS